MGIKKGKSKHRMMVLFMGSLMGLLAGRLFLLTVAEHHKWQSYADDMTKRVVYETAPRGDITDRNGKLLAASRAVYSVNISRVNMNEEDALESAAQVMALLEEQGENVSVTQGEVRETLQDNGYSAYLPVVLAEDISKESAETVEAARYKGVQISKSYVREYPEGALASHIIGYLGRISEAEETEYVEKKGYRKEALIGKSGIERICEDQLKGTDAVSTLQVDSVGNVTELLDRKKPVKGDDVKLTLDLELQRTTEDALQQAIQQAAQGGTFESQYGDYAMSYAKNAAVGAAVALDVKTGEVLAMASCPDFDPNDFTVGISAEKWEALQQENENDPLSPSPLYNVAAMSAVQPGSSFKPVTALAALHCGLDENRSLYDDGAVMLGGRSYGCSLWNDSKAVHGYVDLEQAMKVSCNYYFYDIASGMDLASGTSLEYEEEISNEVILRFADALGLGGKTGIEIDESTGNTPSQALKLQGMKSSLKNFLLAEQETYFKKSVLQNRERTRKYIEKIVNWSDKGLTLDEIIGKLTMGNSIKKDKIEDLANICKYTYYDQSKWSQGDTFNISIGQGDNAYTVLQMANYMAVLGNGGIRNQVTLLSGSNGTSGNTRIKSGISEEDIDCVIDAMASVAMEPGGSLYRAFGSFPYTVAAKTGTAQRAGKISVMEEREYLRRHLHLIAPSVQFSQVEAEADRLMEAYPDVYETERTALRRAVINLSDEDITTTDIDRYKEGYDNFAWTVALAPAEDPQIAVAVMLVQGKSSANAAPVAREIIGKYGEISEWEKYF